jgi:Uma2 family endonuclease
MRLGDRGDIRNQSPVRLAICAEPEPDVAVVTAYPDDPKAYESRHPTSEETLLVVEIADSTLAFELGEKARMYSRRGLKELWVVDLQGHRSIVHREPASDGYAKVTTITHGQTIVPLAFPDVTFTVDEILG